MNYPKSFLDALTFTLKYEGGYANVPGDLGGETNKGITSATYAGYRLHKGLETQSVKNITDDEVKEIYYDRFYLRAGCQNILSEKVALCIMDFVINSGFSNQYGTGGMQLIQKIFKVTADGISGTATQSAINTMINLHGELFVCKLIIDARITNFERLGKSPSQKQFLNGWLARCNDLSKVVGV